MLRVRSLSLGCFPVPCKNTGIGTSPSIRRVGAGSVQPHAPQNGICILTVSVPAQCSPEWYIHPYSAYTVTQILPTHNESREVKASLDPQFCSEQSFYVSKKAMHAKSGSSAEVKSHRLGKQQLLSGRYRCPAMASTFGTLLSTAIHLPKGNASGNEKV